MRVALAQLTSAADPSVNLATVERITRAAVTDGAELVVFPEAMMCAFGNDLLAIAEPIDGPWARAVRALARELAVTIIVGAFTEGFGERVRNTLIVAGPAGAEHYDKIHLYDAFGYRESEAVEAGSRAVATVVDGVMVGVATCYDIRFPALFIEHALSGVAVSVVCASWGAGPDKVEQWRLLARARALDSTTFVVAVGQSDPVAAGVEPVPGAPTGVGHSLVVSPFGAVIDELGAAPDVRIIDLDLTEVDRARSALPVVANRRFQQRLSAPGTI